MEESIHAMADFRFKITNQFSIKISHSLMIHKNSSLPEITTIMTHPQVLAQCNRTLIKKYPHLKQKSGTGKLIDHAMVAKNIKENKLPKYVATMGSKILAKLYDLKIIESDLQDQEKNFTTFLHVVRY